MLVADGVDGIGVRRVVEDLRARGAIPELIAPVGGKARCANDDDFTATRALPTTASVLYDAVVVPYGPDAVAALRNDGQAVYFVTEAYKHAKTVAAVGKGVDLLRDARLGATRLADLVRAVSVMVPSCRFVWSMRIARDLARWRWITGCDGV